MGYETNQQISALMRVYIAKRADLLRFFTLRTSSAEEAEDIVQDICLKLADIDEAGIENPSAYLYRLGTNLMLDRARARRRATARDNAFYQTHRTGPPGGEDEADGPSPEAATAARQQLSEIIQSIDGLPPQCRRVFIMHKLEDHSHAEIAAILGISRSAVEKHMIAALKRLGKRTP